MGMRRICYFMLVLTVLITVSTSKIICESSGMVLNGKSFEVSCTYLLEIKNLNLSPIVVWRNENDTHATTSNGNSKLLMTCTNNGDYTCTWQTEAMKGEYEFCRSEENLTLKMVYPNAQSNRTGIFKCDVQGNNYNPEDYDNSTCIVQSTDVVPGSSCESVNGNIGNKEFINFTLSPNLETHLTDFFIVKKSKETTELIAMCIWEEKNWNCQKMSSYINLSLPLANNKLSLEITSASISHEGTYTLFPSTVTANHSNCTFTLTEGTQTPPTQTSQSLCGTQTPPTQTSQSLCEKSESSIVAAVSSSLHLVICILTIIISICKKHKLRCLHKKEEGNNSENIPLKNTKDPDQDLDDICKLVEKIKENLKKKEKM